MTTKSGSCQKPGNTMGELFSHSSFTVRIILIIAFVIGIHALVVVLRKFGARTMKALHKTTFAKARSIFSLLNSVVIFVLYFAAIGLLLKEFGVSLTAYLASASVLGLAVGFGSQGLVQDVVTGLTLIFSDLVDIGDMVEISGQTGIVQTIGMRFTVLKNHLGAEVYIPNRTITTVVNYPRGYVRCLVDITLNDQPEVVDRMAEKIAGIVTSSFEQLPGLFITQPSSEGLIKTSYGKAFLRVKFRIWPGRGSALETTLKPEIVQALKQIDSNYADWMVMVNYEVEKKTIPLSFRDFPKKDKRLI